MCEYMEGYRCMSRCMRTWEDQMCKDMGGYRSVRTWEGTDV